MDITEYIGITFLFTCFLVGGPINLFVFFRLSHRAVISASRSLLLKLQLNISDLMVLLFYAFAENISKITVTFHGGEVLCRVLKVGDELSFQISSAILACIGVDRLLSVVRPFTPFHEAKRRVKIMICCAWIYSIFFSMDNAWMWMILDIPGDPQTPRCVGYVLFLQKTGQNISQFWQNYELARTIGHMVTVFWLPFFTMVVSYAVIVHHVWKHYRDPMMQQLMAHNSETAGGGTASVKTSMIGKDSKKNRWSLSSKKLVKSDEKVKKSQDEGSLSNLLDPNQPNRPSAQKCGNLAVMYNKDKCGIEVPVEQSDEVEKHPSSSRPTPGAKAHQQHPGSSNQGRVSSYQAQQNREHVIRVRRLPLRMMKTTVCLMNVYFLCWLPYQVAVLWYYIDRPTYKEYVTIIHILHLLVTLNSVINPFIYGLYATEVRPHLSSFDFGACWDTMKFVCCFCDCCGQEQNPTGIGSNQQMELYG